MSEADDWADNQLEKIKAYSRGPRIKKPSDAELLGKAQDEYVDVLDNIVVRGAAVKLRI